AEFESYGKDGWNFLHRCADKQEIEKLKIVCKYGANIDSRTQIQIGKHKISQTPLRFYFSLAPPLKRRR
ncbi:hypothetical protein, partial [Helicobacter rodentium]